MKIRDLHATVKGDTTEFTMESGGLNIISDDGRVLFSITLTENGGIIIDAGVVCRFKGKKLDDMLAVYPIACNKVNIARNPYK
jgi:hypothetical protein